MPRFPQSEQFSSVDPFGPSFDLIQDFPEAPPSSLWSSDRPIQHSLSGDDILPHRLYYWWVFYFSRFQQTNVSFLTANPISNSERHGYRLVNCSGSCRTETLPHFHTHSYFRYNLCARPVIASVVLVPSDADSDTDSDAESVPPTYGSTDNVDDEGPLVIDI
jgi:hypothetical protein